MQVDPRLAEVRDRFIDRLAERLDRVRRDSALALTDADAAERLRRDLHSLVGAAGMFGFLDLAKAAAAADAAVGRGAAPVRVNHLLGRLLSIGDAVVRRDPVG